MKYALILLFALTLTISGAIAQTTKSIVYRDSVPKVKSEEEDDEDKPVKRDFDNEVEEDMKYFKEKYEYFYSEPFDIVYSAVKKSIEDIGCMISNDFKKQTEGGLLRCQVNSDYCVFVEGSDSAFNILKKYSQTRAFTKDSRIIPLIRGGVWKNGRIQYKFTIREQQDKRIYLLMKTEISGYETKSTWLYHFWDSNGIFEHEMSDRIQKNINGIKAKN